MPEYRQNQLDLSNEDNLRLNILLCQDVKAIRINESKLTLFALVRDGVSNGTSDVKEVSVKLTPNCNVDQYVKSVKAFLSSHYLDSPAGFPIFMNRWTRTGQLKNEKIGEFLKIGEPEAVVAITYAENISVEHAKYAWWANSSVENARQLLSHDNIAKSDLASELADFLLEFLPFEIEAKDIILTVKLLIQRGLMDEDNKKSLWKKGQRKSAYLIGFLFCDPKHIPEKTIAHPLCEHTTDQTVLRLLNEDGFAYIKACIKALDGFSNQDSIVLLYEAMNQYFGQFSDVDDTELSTDVQSALIALAKIDHDNLTPVLAQSNAVGSLLRRKLEPVVEPVKNHLRILVSI